MPSRLAALYFRPKAFELYKGQPIYEWLGIKTFKKYLPTTGDIARKKRKIKQIKLSGADKIEELYRYERQTRTYEWRHWIGFVLFIGLTFLLDRKLTVYDWILLPLLNGYINVYPILLQRYNRIRILKVLEKNGLPSPYAQ
jgi:glycosyl-4,4'-diaponeurosporenoate acyltransferase